MTERVEVNLESHTYSVACHLNDREYHVICLPSVWKQQEYSYAIVVNYAILSEMFGLRAARSLRICRFFPGKLLKRDTAHASGVHSVSEQSVVFP